MSNAPTGEGAYLDRTTEILIERALRYASRSAEFSNAEQVVMCCYADALNNDTYLLETCEPRPEPVRWQAGWGVPGINDACEFTTHSSWSDAIEAILDECAKDPGHGHDVTRQAELRRLFYNIPVGTEGWRRVGDLAYWVRKAPSDVPGS